MNKLELITRLKNEANISRLEASRVVQIFFDDMTETMARGERVEIRGLCSFYVKSYKSYIGRNPKTGEKVRIKPKKLPFFKPGKEIRERVDHQ
ncbi:MAG: integration host factor subunit beta [Deltaproteobacteria bacterium]|nr:MAG: integration host factor subunit beta [Deltaproteobacteria bacterium]RTZ98616.1 MAG: integration host factor subunit beta [Deltaproteobacteria bacterium]